MKNVSIVVFLVVLAGCGGGNEPLTPDAKPDHIVLAPAIPVVSVTVIPVVSVTAPVIGH